MFSPDTLQFLFDNSLANSRQWFSEHKDSYLKYVAEPLYSLVNELGECMLGIDGQFVVRPGPGQCVSRISRDMRYVRDGRIYRSDMWIRFARDRRAFPGRPEFWFGLSPDGFSYGCGFYDASPEAMGAYRRLILSGSPLFAAASEAMSAQTVFALCGERYRRPRFPAAPAELGPWLERKSVFACRESADFDELFSDALPQTLRRDFPLLAPLYALFAQAAEDASGI